MILESVVNGPLIWPMIEENGLTRPRKYSNLSPRDAIQAGCDVKATNIILQGLPSEVYALSKFVAYVKLVRDLHTTNIDQLHAYLGQYEFYANENSYQKSQFKPQDSLYQSSQYGSPCQSQQYSANPSSKPLSITYSSIDYQSSVYHNIYSLPQSIQQLEYPPAVNLQPQQAEFPQLDSGLTILVFKQGDDHIDAINHMMSFLSAVITSRYPTTNNQLMNSPNPRQQATINDGKVTLQPVQGRQIYFATDVLAEVHNPDKIDNNMINQSVQAMPSSEQSSFYSEFKLICTTRCTDIIYDRTTENPTLKDELRKLKGKGLVDNVVTTHTITLEVLNIDVEPIASRLLNNKTAHSDYLRLTQEHAAILREHSKLNANSKLICVKCNGYMLFDNHNLCVLNVINDVNARPKSKYVKKTSKRKVWKPTGKVFTKTGYTWRPTGQTFTIVENACPLTRITTTIEVPPKKPDVLETDTPKHVVTLVYSRKPRKSKSHIPVFQIVLWYLDSGCSKHMTEDRSQLTNFINKFLGTVKFKNDHVAKIMGYGDYQIRIVTISRVYYVERLKHNLFFVRQFCDSKLEVAFRQHACFIRNLEGVDLLTESRGNNPYTLSLEI
nr:integrase, catalytic region, zinc finger, CCHC-type, peptidase aspartic, catalytic [Tanacetum cinerariifolium]